MMIAMKLEKRQVGSVMSHYSTVVLVSASIGHPVMGLAARKLLHFPLKILLAASVGVTFISRYVGHFP